MVWAMGLDDFKNRCGDGSYPLLSVIKEVLTREDDCNSATTEAPITTLPTEATTTEATTTEATTTEEPTTVPTTTEATTTVTTSSSGSDECLPSAAYAYLGDYMVTWCINNCPTKQNSPYCPSTHCVCDGSSITTPATRVCVPTATYSNHVGMKKWCDDNCNHNPPYCPSSHCNCTP